VALLKINLLPPKIKAARTQRLVIMVVAAVAIGAASIPLSFLYFKWMSVNSLKAQAEKIKKDSSEYSGVIEKVMELEGKEASLAKKLDSIDKLVGHQSMWLKLLETLSMCQSEAGDLWLTSIRSKALQGADAGKSEITVEGNAFSVASIVVFQELIQKSEMKLETIKQDLPPSTVGDQSVVKFTFTYKVKG
jgi:Tfp pilus assembly protein PilN